MPQWEASLCFVWLSQQNLLFSQKAANRLELMAEIKVV